VGGGEFGTKFQEFVDLSVDQRVRGRRSGSKVARKSLVSRVIRDGPRKVLTTPMYTCSGHGRRPGVTRAGTTLLNGMEYESLGVSYVREDERKGNVNTWQEM
jgi:hypothetical protein